MENATKALLIAGGILIAIIIIWVMVTLFQNTGRTSESYNKRLSAEEIEIFNSNFTKYLGQDLTIHQVVTICNFAKSNGVEYPKYGVDNIEEDLTQIKVENGKRMQKVYTINIS